MGDAPLCCGAVDAPESLGGMLGCRRARDKRRHAHRRMPHAEALYRTRRRRHKDMGVQAWGRAGAATFR